MTMGPEQGGRIEHDEVSELLGAYALDALGPDEVELVEAHLAGCPRCRAEVDQHREMAAALGNGVAPLPPGLWDRIAEEVAATPRSEVSRPPVPFAGPTGPGGRRDAEPSARSPRRDRTRPASRRTSGRSRPRVLAAVGTVAAVVIAFLSVDLAHTNGQLQQARQALLGRSSATAFQAALSTPGHQLVSLRSPTGSPVAQVVVVANGRGYLAPSSMPNLPDGQTYQLWALFGTRAISLGLMGNRPSDAAFTIRSGTPTQIAVTVEPAGGVPTPDRQPVAAGSLAV